jgi:DNA polymerase
VPAKPAAPADHPANRLPDPPRPEELHEAVENCKACDLFEHATHGVTGEGPVPARVMLVGEQPGDKEDLAGAPFVGPAGRLLDSACERAGLNREELYVTNAVKHFRFRARGKRRIHQRPDRWHVSACLPWLSAELQMVTPEVVVAMGVTAAQALLGPQVRIGRDRGLPQASELAELVIVTAHPSAALRMRDKEARREAEDALVADLQEVTKWLSERS